jgi:hypothetical protein
MRTMSQTSTAWMEWLRRSRRVLRVRKARVTGAPAAVVAIEIAIVGGADADAAPEAVREATVVATPAAVGDAEDARFSFSVIVWRRGSARCGRARGVPTQPLGNNLGPQRCGPFHLELLAATLGGRTSTRTGVSAPHKRCQKAKRLKIVSGICWTAVMT